MIIAMEEACRTCQYNQRILERIKSELPSEETTASISDVFKVFSDNTRIRILWTLFDKELCVYDISDKLNMTQSAISHQLRTCLLYTSLRHDFPDLWLYL